MKQTLLLYINKGSKPALGNTKTHRSAYNHCVCFAQHTDPLNNKINPQVNVSTSTAFQNVKQGNTPYNNNPHTDTDAPGKYRIVDLTL